jgi:putative membrane protein
MHRAAEDGMSSNAPDPHIRDHLANERTYLAYVRTSLALLSLGITINRFALFLLERNAMPAASGAHATLVSAEQLGIGMVLLGLVLLLYGMVHFTTMHRQINAQTYRPNLRAMWVLSAIILVGAIGGVLLLFTR